MSDMILIVRIPKSSEASCGVKFANRIRLMVGFSDNILHACHWSMDDLSSSKDTNVWIVMIKM